MHLNSLRIARDTHCLVRITACVPRVRDQQHFTLTAQKGLSSFSTNLKCFVRQRDHVNWVSPSEEAYFCWSVCALFSVLLPISLVLVHHGSRDNSPLRGGPFCLMSMWEGLLQCQIVPGLQAGESNCLLPSIPSRLVLPLLEAFNCENLWK